MRMTRTFVVASLAALAGTGCQTQTPPPVGAPAAAAAGQAAPAQAPAVATASQQPPEKLNVKFLPNAYRVHEKVISGGQPAGEDGFRELADLGVKTVISVDGAQPDIAAAKKFGLRYVHLPHGYDGVPEDRVKELAKAVRDLPGAIYIHCHHGKHRSPAATSAACVAAGLLDPSLAETVLKTAGTSDGYRGLYASAREAQPLDPKLLDALEAEFPEAAEIPPLAEAMVALEHTHDHMKTIVAAGWKSPPDHPDLAPAHEALLLREHFTEMLRSETVAKEPAEFREMIEQSEMAAQELEKALQADPPTEASLKQAQSAFELVNKNCSACHKAYRDVPLREKAK
jgi:protein tyrosine phosphatase (PTP) superfamily phosphohydrolase (DUF442 family)